MLHVWLHVFRPQSNMFHAYIKHDICVTEALSMMLNNLNSSNNARLWPEETYTPEIVSPPLSDIVAAVVAAVVVVVSASADSGLTVGVESGL